MTTKLFKKITAFTAFLLLTTWLFAQEGDTSTVTAQSPNLKQSFFDFMANWDPVFAVVAGLIAIITWLVNSYIKRRVKTIEQKDMHPFFNQGQVYQARHNFIETRYQKSPPSENDEPGINEDLKESRYKLIPEILQFFYSSKSKHTYFLILADTGMGKTTFMINLFVRYHLQWQKWRKRYAIKIIDLGDPNATKEIEDYAAADNTDARRNTILLLDGFDEYYEATTEEEGYKKQLISIMDKVWDSRFVIISCRTHFFPAEFIKRDERQVINLKGNTNYKIRKYFVSPFSKRNVWQFLAKRYLRFFKLRWLNPVNWIKTTKAIKIINKSPNLMARPMLLSYIDDLIKSKQKFEYSFQIYDVLIEKWLDREANKESVELQYPDKESFKKQMVTFTENLAKDIYFHKRERGGWYIPRNEINDDRMLALLGFLPDGQIIAGHEGRTRSLLNRDGDNNFKFSHKSILELILAKTTFNDLEFRTRFEFQDDLDAAQDFYREFLMDMLNGNGKKHIKALEGEKLKTIDLSSIELNKANLQNANLQYANLQYANLKYANLKNAFLYNAFLHNADLYNADLYNANLHNAYLGNANLKYAKLQDANLKYAKLQDAKLENANLKYANLKYAKLENAKLENANLQSANLYNAFLQDANLKYAKLHNANLQSAYLYNAFLQDAKLENANLQSAILQNANLENAYLQYAIVNKNFLQRTDIIGIEDLRNRYKERPLTEEEAKNYDNPQVLSILIPIEEQEQ